METSPVDPLASLLALEKLGIKFGLDNIRALCAALGEPQAAWLSVIIAGTNGKGSVAAMVETGLRASGRRTGLYTSPHLVRLDERFAIDGRPAPDTLLRASAARVLSAIASARAGGTLLTDPTFFEATTAVAFDLFRQAGIDVAVLEVGLGGRFDATNVAQPLAGAITTIDLDHQELLGHTLAAIAFEKAGIVKAGMQVVVGERKPEALEVIARACVERGAVMVAALDDVRVEVKTAGGQEDPWGPALVLDVRTPIRDYGSLPLALRGRHQVDNAVVAVRLLEVLREKDLPVPAAAVRAAVAETRWPGRLDVRMLEGGRSILLDGAHNPAGAAVLASYLEEFVPDPVPVVFGIMKDKDVAGTLGPLLPYASPLILTRAAIPRAMAPDQVHAVARRLGRERGVEVVPSVERALQAGWRHSNAIAACGSLFLVGEVLERLSLPAR